MKVIPQPRLQQNRGFTTVQSATFSAPGGSAAPPACEPPRICPVSEPSSLGRQLSTVWSWLRWPLSLTLLGLLFWMHRADFARLQDRTIHTGWLALGAVLCLVATLLTFVRWYLLVWAQGFEFRMRDAIRIGFLGYLFNYIAPGAVGGDFIKGVFLVREQSSRRLVALSTVVVDRLAGLLALLIVGALVSFVPTPMAEGPEMRAFLSTYRIIALGGTAGLVLLMLPAFVRSRFLQHLTRIPKVGRILGELINSLLLYSHRWRVIVAVLGMSAVGHVLMLGTFYCCAVGIHHPDQIPGFWEHQQFMPAAELAGVFFPLPAGMGALEGAIGYFYKLDGASSGDGVLTGVAYRVISLLIAAVGAVFYASLRREIQSALAAEANRPTDNSEGDQSIHQDGQTAVIREHEPVET